jgi:nitroimidazol reductase NimA-like FMN-containing flavoprotein (pyridoxamine 5'-phosphate oxidase superfamily)
MQAKATFAVTPQTQVRRQPGRASYERDDAHAVLDEALYVTVAFATDEGPCAIPMAFARQGERLVLHGAASSRLQRLLAGGGRVCVTATLVDGIVLARSAMHHSLNYRSVVVFGTAVELVTEPEKLAALERIVEHALPGRSAETRPPNVLELRATRVFALPLEEVSVKRRQGGPLEDADDLGLAHWAGVIPLELRAGTPVSDPLHAPLAPVPPGVASYDRKAAVRPPEARP